MFHEHTQLLCYNNAMLILLLYHYYKFQILSTNFYETIKQQVFYTTFIICDTETSGTIHSSTRYSTMNDTRLTNKLTFLS